MKKQLMILTASVLLIGGCGVKESTASKIAKITLTEQEAKDTAENSNAAAQILVRKAILQEMRGVKYSEDEKKELEELKKNIEIEYFLNKKAMETANVDDMEVLQVYQNNIDKLKEGDIVTILSQLKNQMLLQRREEEKVKYMNSLVEKYDLNNELKKYFPESEKKAEEVKPIEEKETIEAPVENTTDKTEKMRNNNERKIKRFFKDRGYSKIIGRESSMNSAVMVLFCETDEKIYILFEKRAEGIRQGSEISFPGGRRDKKDLSFYETALRETYEEIGLPKERVTDVRKYGTLIIPTGVVVEAYIGYVKNFSLDELNLNKDEVEKILLVPLDYFLENEPSIEYVTVQNNPFYIDKEGNKVELNVKRWGLPEKYHQPWKGTPRRLLFYKYDGETIWGITGEIIYSIGRALK